MCQRCKNMIYTIFSQYVPSSHFVVSSFLRERQGNILWPYTSNEVGTPLSSLWDGRLWYFQMGSFLTFVALDGGSTHLGLFRDCSLRRTIGVALSFDGYRQPWWEWVTRLDCSMFTHRSERSDGDFSDDELATMPRRCQRWAIQLITT